MADVVAGMTSEQLFEAAWQAARREEVAAWEKARRERLAQAVADLDPSWSDLAVCEARAEELHGQAMTLIDQLEPLMAELQRIDSATFTAAVVEAGGDEALACTLHDKRYAGAAFTSRLLSELGALDSLV